MNEPTFGPARTPATERVWKHVDQRGPDECWPYVGAKYSNGYGKIHGNDGIGSGMLLAHRVAYESAHGPIPDGLVIDHVRERGCTRRDCCNPAHLEPVTSQVNVARGRTAESNKARGILVTHCPRGHEYDEANTGFTRQGWRYCRKCKAEKSRECRERANV